MEKRRKKKYKVNYAKFVPAILIIISVLLTMLGGLIPSKIASNKEPVLALRTE